MPSAPKAQTNFADCYVLTPKRTRAFIYSFLDHFLPYRAEYTTTYEVPQFSEHPTQVFHSADALLDYLERHPTQTHTVYWSSEDAGKLRGAMCLFTTDGQVILNLFCETRYPDDALERRYLRELMDFCGSPHGLIEYELPAARDTEEFLQRLASRPAAPGGPTRQSNNE